MLMKFYCLMPVLAAFMVGFIEFNGQVDMSVDLLTITRFNYI